MGRVYYFEKAGIFWMKLNPGDYGQDEHSTWWVRPPVDDLTIGAGSISDHTVVEHEDGTITVSPSIDVNDGQWHGYLEHGVWRLA